MAGARSEVEWIADPAAFAALTEEWDRLARGAGHPFAEHSWFAAWWGAFGAGSSLSVCALRRDGRVVGVYPLCRNGGVLRAMANDHSPSSCRSPTTRRRSPRSRPRWWPRRPPSWSCPRCPRARRWSRSLAPRGRGGASAPSARTSCLRSPPPPAPGRTTAGSGELATVERRRRKLLREHEAEVVVVGRRPTCGRPWRRASASRPAAGRAGRARRSCPPRKPRRSTARSRRPSTPRTACALADRPRRPARGLRHVPVARGPAVPAEDGLRQVLRHLTPGLVLRLSIVERRFELGLEAHELLGDDTDWKRKFATDGRQVYRFRASRSVPCRWPGTSTGGRPSGLAPGAQGRGRAAPLTDQRSTKVRSRGPSRRSRRPRAGRGRCGTGPRRRRGAGAGCSRAGTSPSGPCPASRSCT